jgi:hypothetical protein
MLMEVHKFSKFIHGCAVLLPEEVRAVPYWIDDISLAQSIRQSGAEDLLDKSGEAVHFSQLLPHDAGGNIKAPRTIQSTGEGPPRILPEGTEINPAASYRFNMGEDCCEKIGCDFASPFESMTNAQKMEPKVYFANERTFISWLSMAVNLSSISIAVLAFSKRDSKAFFFGMSLLPLAFLFVVYALWTFLWRRLVLRVRVRDRVRVRFSVNPNPMNIYPDPNPTTNANSNPNLNSEKIKTRDVSRWDDPVGPLLLTFSLIVALVIQFFIKLADVLSRA